MIADLPNLGMKSQQMLARAGITSSGQLRDLGAVAAFVQIKRSGIAPSLNLLWALEGALTGQSWQVVAREHRASLLLALENHEHIARPATGTDSAAAHDQKRGATQASQLDVNAVKEHCGRYAGASSKLYGPPSNVLVYYAGGKKFAYFKTSVPEKWRFSIRTTPERFLELTDMPGIKPARYLARSHWVTIVDVGALPAHYLVELIDWSYARATARRTRA